MKAEIPKAVVSECVHSPVFPQIGSVPPMTAEFDIIDVRGIPFFEHENQFMLGAVKTAHSPVRLGPNAQIFDFGINRSSGG